MLSMEPLLLLPHLPATHSPQLAMTPPQLGTSSHLPAMMQGTSSLAMQQQDHQATTRRVPADTRATSLQRLVTEKLRRAAVASTCQLSLCPSLSLPASPCSSHLSGTSRSPGGRGRRVVRPHTLHSTQTTQTYTEGSPLIKTRPFCLRVICAPRIHPVPRQLPAAEPSANMTRWTEIICQAREVTPQHGPRYDTL